MSSVRKPGDWTCSSCNTHNFASRNVCFGCGRRDLRLHEKKPGDWICPKCMKINFAKRTECMTFACHQKKPETSSDPSPPTELRQGDWICPTCNDVQFKSRVTCRKCNGSKPAQADAAEENTCLICFSKVRNAGFLHRGEIHIVCCMECATQIKQANGTCPMCRQKVEDVIKTIIS